MSTNAARARVEQNGKQYWVGLFALIPMLSAMVVAGRRDYMPLFWLLAVLMSILVLWLQTLGTVREYERPSLRAVAAVFGSTTGARVRFVLWVLKVILFTFAGAALCAILVRSLITLFEHAA